MCDKHYRLALDERKPKCSIEDCGEPSHIKDLCQLHYDRQRRTGTTDLLPKRQVIKLKCAIEECERNSHCRGWCELHYERWRRHGDPEKVIIDRRAPRIEPADIDIEAKICSTCKRRLPLHAFYRRAKTVDGLMYRCKDCCNDAVRKRYAEDENFREHRKELEEKYRPSVYERRKQREQVRNINKYGLTIEEFNALSEAQNNVCAICGQPPRGKTRLSVDHDHETRRVRGLLCDPCNTGLGMFKDSPELLTAAIAYLTKDKTPLVGLYTI